VRPPTRSSRPPAGTTSYSYDARDRLLSAGSTSYTYDENGNELSAGSRTFTWDLANRLKTTTLSPTTTTYTYDGDGNRTQASTGTTSQSKTNFTWDVNLELPQVIRESSGSGGIYRRYFHGLDLLWMSTLENNSNAFYFHSDPLGSVRHVTAQGGATQWTYDYEPFGVTRAQTGSSPTNLVKFTGEYEDPTGLYHLRARQYDPMTARFLSVDPLDSPEGSPSTSDYLYGGCRPTVMADPSGLVSQAMRPTNDAEQKAGLSTSQFTVLYTMPRVSGPILHCGEVAKFQFSQDWVIERETRFLIIKVTVRDNARSARQISVMLNLRAANRNVEQVYGFHFRKNPGTVGSRIWIDSPRDPRRSAPEASVIRATRVLPLRESLDVFSDDLRGRGSVRVDHRLENGAFKATCRYEGELQKSP
jgi:RHS repeat-associated protein